MVKEYPDSIKRLVQQAQELQAHLGLDPQLYPIKVLGEGKGPFSLVLGHKIVIHRASTNSGWNLYIYPTSIWALQLRKMLDVEECNPTQPKECYPADSASAAILRGLTYLFQEKSRTFSEQHTESPVVAEIPKDAKRIEDSTQKPLAAIPDLAWENLPKGAKHWLELQDLEKAKPVYLLKDHVRLSVESSGKTFQIMDDWYLIQGPLHQPFDRSDRYDLPAYSKGLSVPSSRGFSVYFIIPQPSLHIYCIRVQSEEEFHKHFTQKLPEDIRVKTEFKRIQVNEDWVYSKPTPRSIKLKPLLKENSNLFKCNLLNKNALFGLQKEKEIGFEIAICRTALNPFMILRIIKQNEQICYANMQEVRKALIRESNHILVLEYLEETKNFTWKTIPITVTRTKNPNFSIFTAEAQKTEDQFWVRNFCLPAQISNRK